ncbi:MAG TPA: hypothetical protein EYP25_07065 [Anaerolineae bacterium]|nr:hypothetical protein [Anaerolineae bacterium]HIQ11494.1 hypothetical protein [Caldilineales bacterium]
MHKKTFLLLATILTLSAILLLSPVVFATSSTETSASSPAFEAGGDVPTPPVVDPNSVDYAVPPAGEPGFYIIGPTWNPRPGQPYHAAGAYQFWDWAGFNSAPGQYNFDKLDRWLEIYSNLGYEGLGIALYTYTGRNSARCDIMDQGVDAIPEYVQKGRDGVAGTSDDAILLADIADQRNDPGCTNYGGPWYLPDYTNSYYVEQYSAFIHALADHLLNSPYRDKIAWVSIGAGKDGENIPVDNMDDDFMLGHLSVEEWVTHEKTLIDIYTDAFYDSSGFPRIQVTTQNAPFYRSPTERRDIAAYASQKRVGLSINGATSDFNGVLLCDNPNPSANCVGIWDQITLYGNSIPIQLESYGYMTGTENEFYVTMARILQFKADYMRLSYFWSYPGMDTDVNRKIAKWTSKYLGKGLLPGQEAPPSIWSRMNEHRNPTFLNYYTFWSGSDYWPYIGNYEFFLNQKHLPEYGAVTLPVTDDPRIEWTGSNSLPKYQERWHTNSQPFDQKLYDAGLYKLEGRNVQTQVDPGWLARRTDQATGNVRFIFDAADKYFDQSTPTTYKAIVTVTYLDTGTDKWFLQYDSVSGPKPATPYAINDWTPELGLAIDGGLPTTGVLDNPPPYITKTNTGQWKVATFLIEDGNFNNGLFNGNGDLAIDARDPLTGDLDGDEYIHHVDVQKVDEFAEPVKTGVYGFVYVDMNENGQRDPWEPGIYNATITLDGVIDYETISTTSGYYEIEDVMPGQYLLSATPPPGYQPLTPSNIAIFVVDGNMLELNFSHPPIETPSYIYMPLIQTQ